MKPTSAPHCHRWMSSSTKLSLAAASSGISHAPAVRRSPSTRPELLVPDEALDPAEELVRVARLGPHLAGPGEVEHQTLAALDALHVASTTRSTHVHLHRFLVGHHVARVDGDALPRFEVPHLERAVATEHDLAMPFGADDETTFSTEQVLEPAPLGVEGDVHLVGQPRPLLDEERGRGPHLVGRRIAGQPSGDVDEPALRAVRCRC